MTLYNCSQTSSRRKQ